MNTTFVLMTMMLMAHHTVSTCGKGTLVCDTSGSTADSLMCDFKLSYFLKQNGTCEHQKVTGCKINYFMDVDKPCHTCDDGMVLDTKNEGCVDVTVAQMKTNCMTYDKNTAACTACEYGYYLSSGACAVVTTKTEHCHGYSSATECSICHFGYYLKEGKCVIIEAVDNCQFYTDRKCLACASNYHMNMSFNKTINLLAMTNTSYINNLEHAVSFSSTNNILSVCDKITVDNCQELTTSGSCAICNPGYFVNASKSCELYPEDPINNCLIYTSRYACALCQDNFYLKTSTECAVVTNIANCKFYSHDKDNCDQCEDDYYLNGDSSACILRVNKNINNCTQTYSDTDECHLCETNYRLAFEGTKCLPDISNCNSIEEVNGTIQKIICHSCDWLYYLKNNECYPLTVTNCNIFAGINENKCHICDEGHTLEANGSCTKNTKAGCTKYIMNTDICEICDNTTHILDGLSCTPKNVINCSAKGFSDSTSAAECIICNNQWKANAGACESTEQTNCTTTNGLSIDLCTLCNTGWILDVVNNECYDMENYGIDNCEFSNDNRTECMKCLPKFYLEDDTTCTHRINSLSSCATKTEDFDTCQTCETGKYLNTINLCITNNAQHCQNKHEFEDKCATCKPGYWADANYATNGPKLCTLNDSIGCDDFSGKSDQYNTCSSCQRNTHYQTGSGAGLICVARKNSNCRIDDDDNTFTYFNKTEDKCTDCNQEEYLKNGTTCSAVTEITDCALFSTTEDKCKACGDGYYLDIVNNLCKLFPDGITNCSKYSTRTTCISCDHGFYLKSNKCEAVNTIISNCMTHSSATQCHECNSTHFLSDNKCDIKMISSNCKTYATNDTCSACKENYVFNTSTKKCTASGISNCSVAVKGTTNSCTTCMLGYLLSDDKKSCFIPFPAIAKCADPASATKCKTCMTGYSLSLDEKTCAVIGDTAGTNCAWAKQLQMPICDVCRYGFRKNSSGACIALPDESCIIYDDSTSKCNFCTPGTWVDGKGKCNRYIEPPASAAVFKSFIGISLVTLLARLF